jgi:uncharacterized membrane protein YccC
MTTPGLFIGWLIASLVGFAFHFIRGGKFSRLLFNLATAWISFFIGHFVGQWINWHLWRYGTLNLFPALLATLVGLIATSILAGPEKSKSKRK